MDATADTNAKADPVAVSSSGGLGAAPTASNTGEPDARLMRRYLALHDFERAAKRRLPRMLYGFVSGGAETEATLAANRCSFKAWQLVPRVLVDTAERRQSTVLFGRQYAAPFGIAPMGVSALSAYRADIAMARAAAASGIPMVLSASSLIPLEAVRAAGATWYQAYLPGDQTRIEALVDRVAAAGFETLVVTADVPVPANRENNVRNGFSVPLRPSARLAWDGLTHPAWLFGTALRTVWNHGVPRFENMDAERGPPVLARNLIRAVGARDRLTWKHLALIRSRWAGRLVVKGILSPADAVLAREAGADGIIVSNHGGRQLDGAATPLGLLPAIAAVSAGMTVMVDGGIRRGTDVLKALALGADFVFVGRPFLYAAAVGGEVAIRHAMNLLSLEIDRNLALMGMTSLPSPHSNCLVAASCQNPGTNFSFL